QPRAGGGGLPVPGRRRRGRDGPGAGVPARRIAPGAAGAIMRHSRIVRTEEDHVMKRTIALFAGLSALAVLVAAPATAGDKPIAKKAEMTIKATIEAIDHDTRMITLKGKDGEETF